MQKQVMQSCVFFFSNSWWNVFAVWCVKNSIKIWVRLNPDWTVFYCCFKENTNFPLFWGFCLFVFFLPFSASRQQRCEHTSGCHRRKQTKLPIQVSFTTSVGGHKEETLFVCLFIWDIFFLLHFCRMLRSLLSAHGVNPQMITVFIDGYYEVIVLLLLHHSEPRCNCLAPKLPPVGSSICFHVFPSGAHGRGGAVWPEGRPAHANQHQERPSVSGMDGMAPPSMATLGTLLLVHSDALPLRRSTTRPVWPPPSTSTPWVTCSPPPHPTPAHKQEVVDFELFIELFISSFSQDANFAIVLEEDLDVSIDFFRYESPLHTPHLSYDVTWVK